MRFGLTTMAAAGVLIGTSAAPVLAQPADLTPEAMAQHLAEVGTWRFWTRDMGDNRPVCTEVWRFNADGAATIESGEERVTKRWRTVQSDGERWLYTTAIATNGKPDCMGGTSDPAEFPREETGFVVLFFNNGNAVLCEPPGTVEGPDGKPARVWTDEGCWGRLAPLKKG